MSQVSRRQLPKPIEKKIFDIFFKSLARLSNPLEIEQFLFDLLGTVERTMLAKRLAIALLLAKGYRYESIKGALKVSQETIARVHMSMNLKGDGYAKVINKILRDEKLEEVFGKVDDIIIEILPASSLKRTLVQSKNKKLK